MPCVDCDEIDNDIFQTCLHHFIATTLILRRRLNYNVIVVNNLLYRSLHKIYLCFHTFPFHVSKYMWCLAHVLYFYPSFRFAFTTCLTFLSLTYEHALAITRFRYMTFQTISHDLILSVYYTKGIHIRTTNGSSVTAFESRWVTRVWHKFNRS